MLKKSSEVKNKIESLKDFFQIKGAECPVHMSRQPNSATISYTAIANACAELIKQGDKPSLRKLREQLGGGSLSTIHRHYHRWQDEQRHSQKADAGLSDTLYLQASRLSGDRAGYSNAREKNDRRPRG